jgi:hypothetical protein
MSHDVSPDLCFLLLIFQLGPNTSQNDSTWLGDGSSDGRGTELWESKRKATFRNISVARLTDDCAADS